ncbi:MAG: DHHA1 domain-containing protein, partial [Burkholderiales bacterium]|nr:DHHA1 domain-containing protein [Burkholderiales bacterium]
VSKAASHVVRQLLMENIVPHSSVLIRRDALEAVGGYDEALHKVEDRDLWTWRYPESAAYLAALDMEPQSFERWQQVLAFDAPQQAAFIARGQAMDEKFRQLAADMAEAAQPLTFNGVPGLMLNAPSAFHSLLGEMLSHRSGSFALLWTVNAKGLIKVGLRSQRGYDCSPLAESMGGGGHAQACGFRMPASRLPELLSGAFEAQPRAS